MLCGAGRKRHKIKLADPAFIVQELLFKSGGGEEERGKGLFRIYEW